MKKGSFFRAFLSLSVVLTIAATSMTTGVKAETNLTNDNSKFQTAPRSSDYQRSSFLRVPEFRTNTENNNFGLVKTPVKLPSVDIGQYRTYATYPTSFDLRTLGKVTSVKNQGSSGSCWSFATYASLESKLLTGENRDFSENNLKNNSGFDFGPNNGGNSFMSTAYLARWSGPINEADDPYNPASTVSPTNKLVQKHIQNVDFLPSRLTYLDNNTIKAAIMNSGAVFTTFFYESLCFNDVYDTYYDSYSWVYNYGNNHAVAIVGWDDNFDRNKFVDGYNGKVPPGNGAYIVKNSWGSSWGNKGYFYVSYYDENFAKAENAVFNGIEARTNYKAAYQYDPLGFVSNGGYGSNVAWMANVFTASSYDYLSAVSFYTVVPNCKYEVYVCTNYTGTSALSTNRVLKGSGTIGYAGYHTVKLSSLVPLAYGKKFAVIVKLTTGGYGYPIAMEESANGYSSKATAAANQSFVSNAGTTWSDLTFTYDTTANVCLKAFTTNRAPIVVGTTPTNAAINSPVGSNLVMSFSEPIFAGTSYNSITVKNLSGVVIPIQKAISGSTLTINPINNLIGNTKYIVTIPAGAVMDNVGAVFASQYSFSFTTGANTAPKVIATSPSNSSMNFPVANNLVLKFSENIFAGTYYNNITVKNSAGVVVPIQKGIALDSLYINPSIDLSGYTKYIVTIPIGAIKDNQGQPSIAVYTFSFTTGANTAPRVIATTPAKLSTNFPLANNITVKFSEPIFAGTYYGSITVKNSSGTIVASVKAISKDTLIINPNYNLVDNTKYIVTIPAGAVNDNQGARTSAYSFSFMT